MSAKSKSLSKKSAASKKTSATGTAWAAKPAKKPAKAEVAKPATHKVIAGTKPAGKPVVKATASKTKAAAPKAPEKPPVVAKPVPAAKVAPVRATAKDTAPKSAPVKAPAVMAPPKPVAPAALLKRPAAAPIGVKPAGVPTRAPVPAAALRPAAPAMPVMPKAVVPALGSASRPVAPATPAITMDDASKKKSHQRHGFRTSEYVVYPSHGVGKIIAIEHQTIAGMSLELFVINFEQEKMTLRVPTSKLETVRMRKLAEESVVHRAMETLKGRARIKRTMWSRRAQEYESKINSGDLVQISEVVRDLYRAETQPEQSYSERQLFEAALDRMSREIAAIEKLDDRGAVQKIVEVLAKSARGRKPVEDAPVVPPATEEQAA